MKIARMMIHVATIDNNRYSGKIHINIVLPG